MFASNLRRPIYSIQLHPTPSNSIQLHPTPSNSIQLHPTPSNSIQLRPTTIHLTTRLPAPLTVCFDAARNLQLHQQSFAHTGEIMMEGPAHDLAEMGDVMTWEARHFGIRQRLTTKITAFGRPHYFTDVMLKGAFRSMEHRHCFTADGHETLMEDFFAYSVPFGWIGKLFNFLVLKGYMRRLLQIRNNAILAAVSNGNRS